MKTRFGSALFWAIMLAFAFAIVMLLIAYAQGNSYAGFLALCCGLFVTATVWRYTSGDWL